MHALQIALESEGAAKRTAVQDALSFRAERRALFPDAPQRENAVEIREGLAQYTGMRIGDLSTSEMLEHGKQLQARTDDGLVRSFGYVSGPLYGYLLDDASEATDATWRSRVRGDSDLGSMLAAAMA